jgi:hypothetical protein
MTKSRLLDRLRAILVEERDAIRRFDAVDMERASDAKEAVLAELHATPFDDRGPLIEALAELHPELRHNMMLFVHAAAAIAEAKRRTVAPQKLAS